MPHNVGATDGYFDTPDRAERLQLLLHLVRNADEVIYLRAPAGAGKTLFAERMLGILGDEMAVVRVSAGDDSDIPAAAVGQLDVVGANMGPWPENVFAAIGEQGLLLVVDNADELVVMDMEYLDDLRRRGGHLLLVGRGGLPRQAGDNWPVNFVDLPPFSSEQSLQFLLANAGEHVLSVTEGLAAALHRAAQGQPGPLLDGLAEVLSRSGGSQSRAPKPPVSVARPSWQWVTGGVVVVALAAVLVFQDQINALFEPESVSIVEIEVPECPIPEPSAPPPSEVMTENAVPAMVESPAAADVATQPVPQITLPELTPLVPESTYESTQSQSELPKSESLGSTPAAPEEQAVNQGKVALGAPSDDLLAAVMEDAMTAADVGADNPTAAGKPSDDVASTPAPVAKTSDPAPKAAPAKDSAKAESKPPTAAQQSSPDSPLSGAAVVERTTAVPATTAPVLSRETVGKTDAPAPVEDRTAPAENRQVQQVAETAPPAKSSPKPVSVGDADLAWLKSRPAAHYTLQLLGARDRAALKKYLQLHGVEAPHAIFERPLNGRPWYSLVAGDYPSRAAALAARDRLPASMRSADIWPRTFASIQKSL